MRLALVTQYPVDVLLPHGGVEAVSVNLVSALSKYEYLDIHVITLDENITDVVKLKVGNVEVHRIPRIKNSELMNAINHGRKKIQQYIAELKPDIIHSHDTYGLMVKGINIPRVFTIHGFIYGDTLLSQKKFSWLRSLLWKYIEQSGWADQPNIISISPYVRERLTGIATGKIYDIDNPISPDYFCVARNEEPGVIFSAAVISPRKNTLNLIKAVHLLCQRGIEVKLNLAGTVVNEEYGVVVKEYVASNKLEENIHFLGRLNSQEIRHELSKALVFALVSYEENSPMGIEEAMAVGVPVVTSNRCGMPYMVQDGESGYLVDPDDVQDIASRLESLLTDTPLRKQFGVRSTEIAHNRFHPEKVAARTLSVYKNILNTTAL